MLGKYSKSDIHLTINKWNVEFLDWFFYYFTHLGDGIFAACIVLALCFVKYRYAIFLASSAIIAGLTTQLLKHTIFSDAVRPKKFFEGAAEVLQFIPGVDNHLHNSFPSGHATTAFATFFCLSLIVKNDGLKFSFFTLALVIAFSRVYLSQHFLTDIYAGSLIGVTISLLIYQYVFLSKRVKGLTWMEGSILTEKPVP